MIHQLIFATPKPGMSEAEFQNYWVEVHAVKYASQITQIRKYMVCTRIDLDEQKPEQSPLFSGVAEIWLQNEVEQLASLQSDAFIHGAREDEPRWAAFWATLGLDTNTHTIIEGPPLTANPSWVKLYVLLKRREGLPLKRFRSYLLEQHAALITELPGLRRYQQCHVRDSFYAVGESRFDAVEQWWFDDREALRAALASDVYRSRILPEYEEFAETRYRFTMAAEEHWVIGPHPR